MVNRCEGSFDRLADADRLPVLNGEVVEGRQRVSIFRRAIGGIDSLDPCHSRLDIWRGNGRKPLRIVVSLGRPNSLEAWLGLRPGRLRELVEDVHHVMPPTATMAGRAELQRHRQSRARLPPMDRGSSDRSRLGRSPESRFEGQSIPSRLQA